MPGAPKLAALRRPARMCGEIAEFADGCACRQTRFLLPLRRKARQESSAVTGGFGGPHPLSPLILADNGSRARVAPSAREASVPLSCRARKRGLVNYRRSKYFGCPRHTSVGSARAEEETTKWQGSTGVLKSLRQALPVRPTAPCCARSGSATATSRSRS